MESIKAIQAQQIYRVQPVAWNDGTSSRQQKNSEVNFFANGGHNLNYPSIKGSDTVGRSLDLLA